MALLERQSQFIHCNRFNYLIIVIPTPVTNEYRSGKEKFFGTLLHINELFYKFI